MQLTSVVDSLQGCGGGIWAGGQQHLGQHGGADFLQMSHSQLTYIVETVKGQDLPHRGTLWSGGEGEVTMLGDFIDYIHEKCVFSVRDTLQHSGFLLFHSKESSTSKHEIIG